MPCGFCRTKVVVGLCDYPTSSIAKCQREVCAKCAGYKDDLVICPDHRARAGLAPLVRLDTENARWISARYDGKCKVPDCRDIIEEGDRVYYLPKENGVVCQSCAETVLNA